MTVKGWLATANAATLRASLMTNRPLFPICNSVPLGLVSLNSIRKAGGVANHRNL